MAKIQLRWDDLIEIDGKRYIEKADGKLKAVCGAKKRDGTPCSSPPMANGRCRMHGGKSLGGLASPRYKHGRYSKYAPSGLLERYKQALEDPELLRLDDEISLVDVRISELLETLGLGDSQQAWYELGRQYAKFMNASSRNDIQRSAAAINRIGKIIKDGRTTMSKWQDLLSAFEARRKLVESERKRRVDMQNMLTAEDMTMILTVVQNTIKKYVPPNKLSEVANEFRNILLK